MGGGAQIVAFAGVIETTGFFQAKSTTDGRGSRGEGTFLMSDSTESGEPGNYGVGFPNFVGKVDNPEVRKKKLAAELANGRLAMVAIIGMFFQDGLTGSAWGDWANYTESPLRAFEGEIGVQAPVGFWDPLGFAAEGDKDFFLRRREVEIKHGRISMLATIGYIIGMFYQDGLTGSAWGDWSLYADSPLRAFENELGVQAPVGFWDPLGLSKDGDAEQFQRR